MNTSLPIATRRHLDLLAMIGRWLLGAWFLYMGWQKTLHPEEFLKLARQYELVEAALPLNSIAALLPWFEVFCGLLLLAGVAVRGTSAILLALLVPFTIVIFLRAWLLHTQHALPFCAIKFDCGCGLGEVYICHKLLENILLMVLSAWLLTGAGRSACARHRLV
jgi:uncharacterized membrane protein YphA (DoxX/SURF4 family)